MTGVTTLSSEPVRRSFAAAAKAFMCGAARCAFKASRLSQHSTNVSVPGRFAAGKSVSQSSFSTYEMHPFSALTFARFAFASSMNFSRQPSFNTVVAITKIILVSFVVSISKNINHLWRFSNQAVLHIRKSCVSYARHLNNNIRRQKWTTAKPT